MLRKWNAALEALRQAVQHPDAVRPFIPYGVAFQPSELVEIPSFDMPAGIPTWMRGTDGWAARTGTTTAEKRRTITVQVPAESSPDTVARCSGPEMKYILKGRVATMDAAFTVLGAGAIYIDGPNIAAVQDAAAPPPPGFADATAVSTAGVIFPGLIELHNHLSYNALTIGRCRTSLPTAAGGKTMPSTSAVSPARWAPLPDRAIRICWRRSSVMSRPSVCLEELRAARASRCRATI